MLTVSHVLLSEEIHKMYGMWYIYGIYPDLDTYEEPVFLPNARMLRKFHNVSREEMDVLMLLKDLRVPNVFEHKEWKYTYKPAHYEEVE